MVRTSALRGGDYHASVSWSETFRRSSSFRSSAADAWAAVDEAVASWVPHVMRCKNPYVSSKGEAYGCGQCLPCRINRRRVWMHRILLESLQQKDNSFVTLTYSPDKTPTDGVSPRVLQLWLKRLRKEMEPIRIRFFGVGEYGDRTGRPHYHSALFGLPSCARGGTVYSREGQARCCPVCRSVERTWGQGRVHCGTLTPHSAAYIAGYVTKKMTRSDDVRLEGRNPEFARMSLRPGIGGDATWELASVHLQWAEDAPDVATALRHGGRILPLGRYLTGRLRNQVGRDAKAPKEVIEKIEAELLDVRMASEAIAGSRAWWLVMKDLLIEKNRGAADKVERRELIFRKRSVI